MTAGVQSVLLDDAIYIHGEYRSFDEKYVLYKYSITKKSWYKLRTKAAGYALATYESKVVMIGGVLPTQCLHQETYNETSVVLDDDCGLEEKLNSALQQVPDLGDKFKFKNACAVSEGEVLIVIGVEEQKGRCNEILVSLKLFNGSRWSFGESTIKTNIDLYCNKTLHILNGEVYMAFYRPHNIDKLFRTSLKSLMHPSDEGASHWNEIEKASEGNCYHLTILGNHLIRTGVCGRMLRVYAYLPSSTKWVKVEDLPIALQFVTCCWSSLTIPY